MQSMRVELKDAPELKQVILAAFPSYRKKGAYFSAFAGPANVNSYWDGGSRDEHAIVELATMRRKSMPSSHPFFDVTAQGMANQDSLFVYSDRVGNLYLKDLPVGFALVTAGTFCGKANKEKNTMEGKYLKRALKADGKGGLCLDCECGERIPIPVIKGLPMTYICGKCGIEYDSRGWIIGKAVQS